MKNRFRPMRDSKAQFGRGDTLVLFGELYDQGYASGLVKKAVEQGMQVIYSTVGRRDQNGNLCPLSNIEIDQKKQSPLINIPLEAGFEHEKVNGQSLSQLVRDSKELLNVTVDWEWAENAIESGRTRLITQMKKFILELENILNPGSNVIFLHTMAGGVPAGDNMLETLVQLFKPLPNQFLQSEVFFATDFGKLCERNFQEVTAESFRILIEMSSEFRQRRMQQGSRVRYLAYGYHGTEIYFSDNYRWQGMGLYIQAKAKLKLEDYAFSAWQNGVRATVFNVPECITNSSKIFPGIEIPIYLLLKALQHEAPNKEVWKKLEHRFALQLKVESNIEFFLEKIEQMMSLQLKSKTIDFNAWPMNSKFEEVLKTSDWSKELKRLHLVPSKLLALDLSEIIVNSCGHIMLAAAWGLDEPVLWIGHDLVSKIYWRENS